MKISNSIIWLTTICSLLVVVTLNAVSSLSAQEKNTQESDSQFLPKRGTGLLFLQGRQKVAAFRNVEKLFDTRLIASGSKPRKLAASPVELKGVKIVSDKSMSLDEYFDRGKVGGLIVIKNRKIVYERYGFGNDPHTKWVSFSVTKSIVSLLVGAAIRDGYIKSVDEKVTQYLPRLNGTPYEQVTIKQLLQMNSGVEWNEDYADPKSDVARATYDTLGLYQYMKNKKRVAEPGKTFNYNTAETNLVGTLLRSAIGNNLSTYLSAKIWKPYGMHSDATWQLTESDGGEAGGYCISATLRDNGLLGLFVLDEISDNARITHKKILPNGWIKESTKPSAANDDYGYMWWLYRSGAFCASGIFGQGIYINPKEDLVIAIQSARKHASRDQDWALQSSLYLAIEKELKSSQK